MWLGAQAGGSVSMSEEDSFIFRSGRGFHMLTHRSEPQVGGWPPRPSTGCGGGHLYSLDLRTWFVGENAFGHSAAGGDQCDIELQAPAASGNLKLRLTSRQRPVVFADKDGRRFLYTGASGPAANVTEYEHSFTLVQEIKSA